MSVFAFVLGLFSVVMGLGMSTLVRSMGQMIEARGHVEHYWVHSCFMAIVFAAQVVTWLSLWRFSRHSPWTVLQALLILCPAILLYLVSRLISPEIAEGRSYDLRAWYFNHVRWTQGLLLAVALIRLSAQRYIDGYLDQSLNSLASLVFAVVLLPGIANRRPAVHAAQATALVGLMALGVALISTPMG